MTRREGWKIDKSLQRYKKRVPLAKAWKSQPAMLKTHARMCEERLAEILLDGAALRGFPSGLASRVPGSPCGRPMAESWVMQFSFPDVKFAGLMGPCIGR